MKNSNQYEQITDDVPAKPIILFLVHTFVEITPQTSHDIPHTLDL